MHMKHAMPGCLLMSFHLTSVTCQCSVQHANGTKMHGAVEKLSPAQRSVTSVELGRQVSQSKPVPCGDWLTVIQDYQCEVSSGCRVD